MANLSLEITRCFLPGVCRYQRITSEQSSYVIFEEGSNTFLHLAQGAIKLVFPDGRGSRKIGAGETAIVPHKETHSQVYRISFPLELYTVDFRLPEASDISIDDLALERQTPSPPARLVDFFRQYLREQESGSPCDLVRAQLLRLMLIMTEPEDSGSNASSELNLESVVTQIDAFIASHYAEGIEAPTIAAYLRYNLSYLERVYRSKRGTSITQSIIRRRVHEACALLRSGSELSITEVATLCGFADIKSFRKAFKQIIGRTPSAFRDFPGDE